MLASKIDDPFRKIKPQLLLVLLHGDSFLVIRNSIQYTKACF